jgi:hypothetical protein
MKNNTRVIFAIAMLALAALACQAVSGGGDVPVPEIPTIEAPEIEIPTIEVPEIEVPDVSEGGSDVILSDDFSSDQWGTGTDADRAVEYIDEALNFNVFTENYFVWSTPDDETYQNVHMEATVTVNGDTDSTTAFGFICNKSVVNDFYYLAMTPAGQYAIALAKTGQTDVFLTNNDEWADSDLIAVSASSYQVGADCGNGTLTLYVDGVEVASVNDSSYTEGRVAVFVWSGEDPGLTTDVSFDDFVMTELP